MVLRNERTELLVGLFVLVGLAIMGGLIIQFGRFSDRLREKYELTLTFPDGGDIVGGSPVRLGGARVGAVAGEPELNDDSTGVIIPIEIYDGKMIPEGARFSIGTSGLMGDAYIKVTSPKEPTGDYIPRGAVIAGDAGGLLSDFTEQGGELIADLSAAVADIRTAVVSLDASFRKIEEGVLSDANIANLSSTLEDFKDTGESVKDAAEKIVPAVEKADEAMATAKEAMEDLKGAVAAAQKTFDTATEIVEKAGPAVEDFGPTIASLREAIVGINEAVDKITEGEGAAAALISDRQLRRDLESFISNLNEHGILGYENDAAKREAEARERAEKLRREQEAAASGSNPAAGGESGEKRGWWPFWRRD